MYIGHLSVENCSFHSNVQSCTYFAQPKLDVTLEVLTQVFQATVMAQWQSTGGSTRGVLGLTRGGCWPFHFLYLCLITSIIQ